MKDIDGVRALLDLGAVGVCVDIAHGHSDQMMRFVEQLKRSHPDKQVIAGNVCTAMAYHDLVNAGADAVKVGIGPGAACTTRMVTGFGVPQFTAVRDCAAVADKLRVPLIADGGIRGSRDIVLALAAGASSVMVGKLFAVTEESAAEKRPIADNGGALEAKYRGQASKDFQIDFYGGLKRNTVPEGTDFWAPVSGKRAGLHRGTGGRTAKRHDLRGGAQREGAAEKGGVCGGGSRLHVGEPAARGAALRLTAFPRLDRDGSARIDGIGRRACRPVEKTACVRGRRMGGSSVDAGYFDSMDAGDSPLRRGTGGGGSFPPAVPLRVSTRSQFRNACASGLSSDPGARARK